MDSLPTKYEPLPVVSACPSRRRNAFGHVPSLPVVFDDEGIAKVHTPISRIVLCGWIMMLFLDFLIVIVFVAAGTQAHNASSSHHPGDSVVPITSDVNNNNDLPTQQIGVIVAAGLFEVLIMLGITLLYTYNLLSTTLTIDRRSRQIIVDTRRGFCMCRRRVVPFTTITSVRCMDTPQLQKTWNNALAVALVAQIGSNEGDTVSLHRVPVYMAAGLPELWEALFLDENVTSAVADV